jgi:hypothetical protein
MAVGPFAIMPCAASSGGYDGVVTKITPPATPVPATNVALNTTLAFVLALMGTCLVRGKRASL